MLVKWIGIAKLQEEMGELQTVLGKLMAYPDGNHPDMRYAGPLLHRLNEELADVAASILFFQEANNISSKVINERIAYKLARYRKWDSDADGMTGVWVGEDEE